MIERNTGTRSVVGAALCALLLTYGLSAEADSGAGCNQAAVQSAQSS